MSELVTARVRVPCSTSNLGSGYDTIGLALNRYLEAEFTPGGHELSVVRSGTLADIEEATHEDLVARALASALAEHGVEARGTLSLTSDIPVARGLGSSAAATLAGYDLARATRGEPRDDVEIFARAYKGEGHGDNAAPCLFGGLQMVVADSGRARAVPLELSTSVGFAYAAPAAGISTTVAREALPKHVAHDTAARALSRVVALERGLATGDPELIHIGIEDELHVPHRLPMIPGAYNALGAGYDAGAWAVTISGAGSGLIAICDPAKADAVAAAMREVFAVDDASSSSVGFVVTPDFNGLTRISA